MPSWAASQTLRNTATCQEGFTINKKTKTRQGTHTLYVCSLREQVKPPQTLQHISVSTSYNLAYIPCLCVDIAAHIHHGACPEQEQLFDESVVASFPGWIHDDHCFIRWQISDDGEDVLGFSSTKRALVGGDTIQRDVVPGGANRFLQSGVRSSARSSFSRIIKIPTVRVYTTPITYLGNFYSNDGFEKWRQGDGEQSAPAVRVDEMLGFFPSMTAW